MPLSNFEFATATRILFGEGAVRDVPAAARAMGRRALFVTGASPGRAAPLRTALEAAGVECIPFAVPAEPTLALIRSAPRDADLVIAIGGGSVLDAGKALAAMLTNPGDPLDFLEVIGRGLPLKNPAAPCIAIPTTAGTGSEVTRNAVLASPEHRVKASLRAAGMLPRLAVVDPELTHDLPRAITASTGLDALTQLIEPYIGIRANPMTDLFCVDGMRRAAAALPRACQNGADREARSEMAFCSLLGGLALANAGLGAVHGFAAPIGGMFDAPHGAVCAALLPHAMDVNVEAVAARQPAPPRKVHRGRPSPHQDASRDRRRRRGMAGRPLPPSRNPAAPRLRHHRRRHSGAGRKGGAGQQHERQPRRPHHGGITRNHLTRALIFLIAANARDQLLARPRLKQPVIQPVEDNSAESCGLTSVLGSLG